MNCTCRGFARKITTARKPLANQLGPSRRQLSDAIVIAQAGAFVGKETKAASLRWRCGLRVWRKCKVERATSEENRDGWQAAADTNDPAGSRMERRSVVSDARRQSAVAHRQKPRLLLSHPMLRVAELVRVRAFPNCHVGRLPTSSTMSSTRTSRPPLSYQPSFVKRHHSSSTSSGCTMPPLVSSQATMRRCGSGSR